MKEINMNSGYEWLLLKTGEIVIGIKADRPVSWAVLERNGRMSAVVKKHIVSRCHIREPKVIKTSCDVLLYSDSDIFGCEEE